MTSDQKYEGKGNSCQPSEQTAQNDYYPGKFVSGTINHPAIPDYAQDMDIELKESIDLMGREETHPSASVMLNAVYAAYALGQKMATPDQPTLPTVFLQLAAVADVEQKQRGQRSELEAVMEAISRFTTHAACSESEREMLTTILEGLQMDLFDLLGRLYAQTQTEEKQ